MVNFNMKIWFLFVRDIFAKPILEDSMNNTFTRKGPINCMGLDSLAMYNSTYSRIWEYVEGVDSVSFLVYVVEGNEFCICF